MRSSLVALGLVLATPALADTLEYISTFEWETASVVGLSGIEVASDGVGFTAIGDRGWLLEGEFKRDGETIAGLAVDRFLPILGLDGLPVAARRVGDWSDTEGLAISVHGAVWISSERYARVWSYDTSDGLAHGTGDHETFRDMADNRQLEALAVKSDGTFYTFAERPTPDGFAIYRHSGTKWEIDGYLPERDGFSIVGADFDDTDALWILERKLAYFWWWQNRIRRVQLGGSQDETIWTGKLGQFHNLEGIAAWRDDKGLRLTLVSDDNANPNEVTQFVEFRLTD